MATIKDIADAVGVSIGTVDRIIHERGRYSEKTAENVRRIMEELNYTPNIHARGLKKTRSHTFSAVIPECNQDAGYWRLVEKGILKASAELGSYSSKVNIFHFDRYSSESCLKAMTEVLDSGSEGLLIAPVIPEVIKEKLINVDVPYLFIDTDLPEMNNRVSFIGQDSFQSGILSGKLMGLLLSPKSSQLERSSVLVIKPPGNNDHLQRRISGFCRYLEEHISHINLEHIEELVDDRDSIHQFLEDYFSKRTGLPDGIFVANSSVYYIASYLEKKEEKFRRIPLIGYDLIPGWEYLIDNRIIDFILTQQPEEQGYRGIMLLYNELVLNKEVRKELIIPLNIITKENLHTFNNILDQYRLSGIE